LGGIVSLAASRDAYAIPAFAAQTGEPCSACHMGFPELTPFGREFKLNGYVTGGMFPDLKNLTATAQIGFTQLHGKVPGGLAPDFPSNNVWSVQETSLFYGGAIYAPIGLGAFVQTTYDGIAHQFAWDNTDIRLAQHTTLFGKPLVYGFTFNNNPTVTDLWNTLPAWGYPFVSPELGGASVGEIQLSALAQQVFGAGAYAALNISPNDMIYSEADLYKSLPNRAAFALGVGPGVPIAGPIPYWRLALQHDWASNSLEVGTVGLIDHPYPAGLSHGPTDDLVDLGVDSQYQWITQAQSIALQASYIHEMQHWAASFPLGATSNLNDTLNTITLTASYLLQQRYGITESFNDINGSQDAILYAPAPISGSADGKPDTTSFTTELDYYPFNNGGPAFFPWANAKFFVQATIYPEFNGSAHNFDGSGRSAQDNDVLFTGVWLAF
jgi:hypothetical protein